MKAMVSACVLASMIAGGLMMAGCRPHHDRVVVSAQIGTPAPEPAYVYVQEPPPRVIVEQRPPRPAETYIWIDGYWNWSGGRYVWIGGRWEAPPARHGAWVAPRYDRDPNHGYRYTPGHWNPAPAGAPGTPGTPGAPDTPATPGAGPDPYPPGTGH